MVSLSGFLCLKSGDFIYNYVVFASRKGQENEFSENTQRGAMFEVCCTVIISKCAVFIFLRKENTKRVCLILSCAITEQSI